MKTILITAYAVNPYKGSEDGTGWNLICQAARCNKVIAVTRKNNRPAIEKFMNENDAPHLHRIRFLYFDFPKWMIIWKKGPLLSALYFYWWQLGCAIWLQQKNLAFDIAHSLNFHSNWTPGFLWILGKPFVWGPVGNHPPVPAQYIRKIYGWRAFLKDRLLWAVKWCSWHFDPLLALCRYKAVKVFCVNTQAAQKLKLPAHKIVMMPAVASEDVDATVCSKKEKFTVLSVGRFVPLKGFDLTLRAYHLFYKQLSRENQARCELVLIGSGPEEKKLQALFHTDGLSGAIIKKWMPRAEVMRAFGAASVYLFPSHEGAGMVVAEAMSYGLPVVCLDNYGPGEYTPPASQLKVPHQSYDATVQALAGKLQQLFFDTNFYQTESNLARQRYESLFRWEVKGQYLQTVYDSIIPLPLHHAALSSAQH
jgi:glycosyltransferase involved in cell wall biosynthesis